ncbi:MAG: PKD domain-containing protein [Candidatus Omnitrophica bacterium]|nr:PKD domain-containing protein [Candidatus Omnitrophota bacterium]
MKVKGKRALKKILILLFFAFILSGCATYKFQKSTASGAQGYLASYDNEPILEYTVGKEKSLPDLALAKERFKRRRATVEYYYKQMGQIEPRLKEVFWEPPAMLVDLLGGILRWPFIAVSDYKYNHNPKYKERMDRLDEEKDALEKARINSLKEKLASYIVNDLAKEPSSPAVVTAAPAAPKPQPEAPQKLETPRIETPVIKEPVSPAVTTAPAPASPVQPPAEIKPVIAETAVLKTVLGPPVAVITAKPIKGYSPLTVKFSGQKSYSKNGKIVAYNWNFGDGDTSTKKNPENTYWSATYGRRNFTVTLTVKDAAGLISSTTSIIEVSTP